MNAEHYVAARTVAFATKKCKRVNALLDGQEMSVRTAVSLDTSG